MLHCLPDKREKEGDWQTQVGGGRSSEVKKKKKKKEMRLDGETGWRKMKEQDREEWRLARKGRQSEPFPVGVESGWTGFEVGGQHWVGRWEGLKLKASSLPHFQFHLPFYSSEVIISFISSEKCESSDFSGSPGCRSLALTDTRHLSQQAVSVLHCYDPFDKEGWAWSCPPLYYLSNYTLDDEGEPE